MGAPLGNQTIVRVRAPIVTSSRDGVSEYRDWENAQEVVFTGVLVQPFKLAEGLGFEFVESREFARSAFRFFLRGEQDFLSTDRILWDVYDLEVFAQPAVWHTFDGTPFYTGVLARVSEG